MDGSSVDVFGVIRVDDWMVSFFFCFFFFYFFYLLTDPAKRVPRG